MSARADTNCHDIFNFVSATRTHWPKLEQHVVSWPTCCDMSATFPAKQQGDRQHDYGDGQHNDGDGRHDDGKGQQGVMRHDNADGRHDDGKGQQGDRRHDDGDGRHDNGKGQQGDRRHEAARR